MAYIRQPGVAFRLSGQRPAPPAPLTARGQIAPQNPAYALPPGGGATLTGNPCETVIAFDRYQVDNIRIRALAADIGLCAAGEWRARARTNAPA